MPSIISEDLARSLGEDIQPEGNVRLPRALWESFLDNLSKAHLNPIQKVEAIWQILVAKIQYQLRLSDHVLEEAMNINRSMQVKSQATTTWEAPGLHKILCRNIPFIKDQFIFCSIKLFLMCRFHIFDIFKAIRVAEIMYLFQFH